jgi:hypothetical protein
MAISPLDVLVDTTPLIVVSMANAPVAVVKVVMSAVASSPVNAADGRPPATMEPVKRSPPLGS